MMRKKTTSWNGMLTHYLTILFNILLVSKRSGNSQIRRIINSTIFVDFSNYLLTFDFLLDEILSLIEIIAKISEI